MTGCPHPSPRRWCLPRVHEIGSIGGIDADLLVDTSVRLAGGRGEAASRCPARRSAATAGRTMRLRRRRISAGASTRPRYGQALTLGRGSHARHAEPTMASLLAAQN